MKPDQSKSRIVTISGNVLPLTPGLEPTLCWMLTDLPRPATQCTATQQPGSSMKRLLRRLSQSSTTLDGGGAPSSNGQSCIRNTRQVTTGSVHGVWVWKFAKNVWIQHYQNVCVCMCISDIRAMKITHTHVQGSWRGPAAMGNELCRQTHTST